MRTIKTLGKILPFALALYALPKLALAQTPAQPNSVVVPEWALPESPTHHQVSPPADFHRAARTEYKPIGIFTAQSDVGAALAPGSSTYDSKTKQYTINSAGYNIWYVRDEFRYLWKKMSGNVSLAGDIIYTDPDGFGDRKAALVIRQSLDDDSKEAIVALHGAGMLHLAWRPEKGARVRDMEYRIGSRGALPGGKSPDALVTAHAKRIGIQKQGDEFALFVSFEGEPMHQLGAPIKLKLDGPFYVGIGFCSHIPDKVDTAIIADVVLVNAAGKVK